MKTITHIIAIAFLVANMINATAQQRPAVPLKIGDTIPNLVFDRVLNQQTKVVKIADLYSKGLLIIDFWATWCGSCINEMKTFDTLLAENSGSLNILSVCHDKEKLVGKFLGLHPEIKNSKFFITSQDSLVTLYFPHRSLPHNVWINKRGIVVAITSSDEINARNIKATIASQRASMRIKHDAANFNMSHTYHVPDSSITYRSIITRYNDSISSGYLTDQLTWNRFFAFNRPITQLYWLAYTRQFNSVVNWNLVELHTKDSIKFYNPLENRQLFDKSRYNLHIDFAEEISNWLHDNEYCYELTMPGPTDADKFSSYMFNDLSRYLHIDAKIEKRNIECLSMTLDPALAKTLPQSNEIPYIENYHHQVLIRNVALDDVLQALNCWIGKTPLSNDSGENPKINLTINYSEKEPLLEKVKEEFQKYGYRFTKKVEPYPILVLYDGD